MTLQTTPTRQRVDRDDELILLARLAHGETPARIALIESASGMGKSELLREFRARYAASQISVVVDFKGGGLNLADVLFHICDTLGWRRFSTLSQAVQSIVQSTSVLVSGNFLVGQNEISIALSAPDEQTRELRRSQLTTALMADLRAFDQLVLVFDVFEKCDPSLEAWFTGVFLPAVHRSPKLAVIVAGQRTPEKSQMWEAEFLSLAEIAPEHWLTYAQAVGATRLTLEFIHGCCVALKGHCLTIANTIESQRGVDA